MYKIMVVFLIFSVTVLGAVLQDGVALGYDYEGALFKEGASSGTMPAYSGEALYLPAMKEGSGEPFSPDNVHLLAAESTTDEEADAIVQAAVNDAENAALWASSNVWSQHDESKMSPEEKERVAAEARNAADELYRQVIDAYKDKYKDKGIDWEKKLPEQQEKWNKEHPRSRDWQHGSVYPSRDPAEWLRPLPPEWFSSLPPKVSPPEKREQPPSRRGGRPNIE